MRPHPRLLANQKKFNSLKKRPGHPLPAAAWDHVAKEADKYVRSPKFYFKLNHHNSFLVRARIMQGRVQTLLGRWLQTGKVKYRKAVLSHIAEIGGWECWSWITWRKGDHRPNAIFDLSYGENSYTLALAYDWLYYTLTPAEKKLFISIARKWSFKPFLASVKKNRYVGWFRRPDSNWNTVCSGGAGMLALAMYEDVPEAPRVLKLVEQSVKPFFMNLQQTGGGWPEGVGYWNYGMSYGFTYLLCYESATGRKHPLFKVPGVKKTLAFPLDFSPNGIPSSFGDVNRWVPQPFHYAAARRLGMRGILSELDKYADPQILEYGHRDKAVELLLMHPGRSQKKVRTEKKVVKLYKGLDWGILADRLPDPDLFMSVRGGTTEVPHGHMDLLSFQVVASKEVMVANLGVEEYLDTTFSERRYELFETAPPAKNTILINGVGISRPSVVKTFPVSKGSIRGIRIDASGAMGVMRDGPVAQFCGRIFLMLGNYAFLVIDRVELPQFGRMESRLHTYADVKEQRSSALLKKNKERMRISYACSVPASLHAAVDAPTTPGKGATLLRWCADDLHKTVIMATLLAPGNTKGAVAIKEIHKTIQVSVNTGTGTTAVTLKKNLQLSSA